ncbi:hypothetical protein ACFVFS_18400 [Kitasatospora sp. NPDC057692]|uniref:hypothetical protein n=1 Tax=Kitasatospora sp. NPDC057692 TaxID=3346215 RepID=UPI0036C8480E
MDDADLTPATLLQQGLEALKGLLGPSWTVTLMPERGAAAMVEVRAEGDSVLTQLLVDPMLAVTPRAVEETLVPKVELLRQLNHYTNLMVMAPWISTKAQQLLRQHNIGYLDLTGNVSLRVSRPAIVVYTEGALQAPRALAAQQSKTTLGGPKAGRLVRLLVDARPPYRASELANASTLSLAYVSRLLGTLEDQLLIRREGRTITDVDWRNLLRERAAQASLLRPGTYIGMIAPNGIPTVLNRIKTLPPNLVDSMAVTGSYVARQIAPVAAGGQLMLYVAPWARTDDFADDLGLLPVPENADVLLIQAPDQAVFARTVAVDGVPQVGLSQLVLDCLSGPGRMPAEGEAVLEYMSAHEGEWRAFSISDLRQRLRP